MDAAHETALRRLLDDLERHPETFTDLFRRGCDLLALDDRAASVAFGTSRPNVSRWRRGVVVPPSAVLVLRELRRLVEGALATPGEARVIFRPRETRLRRTAETEELFVLTNATITRRSQRRDELNKRCDEIALVENALLHAWFWWEQPASDADVTAITEGP